MPYPTPTARTAVKLLVATLVAFVLMLIAGQAAMYGLLSTGGIDILNLTEATLDAAQRQYLRLGLFANNTLMFAGSAVLGLWYIFQRDWTSSVYLDRGARGKSLWYAVGFFLVTLPLVAYSAYLNLQLPLPEWAASSEAETDKLLVHILTMESFGEFALAFLTIAVSAGVGEELLLRGTLQHRIFRGWFRNHHLAIWLAAAIFSSMHIEFAGFFPRLFLGVSLGYAYFWTRSLWVPIILHLAFNGLQVIVAYVTGEFDPAQTANEEPSLLLAAISLPVALYLAYRAEQLYGDAEVVSEENPANPEAPLKEEADA